MRVRRGLLAALALAAVVLAVPALARAYYLQSADVAVRVAPNGALLVTERITIGGAYHGAYRDIPLRKGESIDRITVAEGDRRYTRGGSTKLGSIDRSDTFNYETSGKRVRIVWHFLAAGEPRTFTIGYRFRGLTVAYDDVADVNLKVWGQSWSASLPNLTASMTLPRPAALDGRYRVYGHPAWVHGVVERTPTGTTLRAVGVPSHQWVELRTVFPRAELTSTAGARVVSGAGLATIIRQEADAQAAYQHDRDRLDGAKNHPGRTLLYLLLLGAGPAIAVILVVWVVFGRERRTGYDREYEQQPPSDTAPALVPPLLRQSTDAGSQEFTATLFELIRRGRYASSPVSTEKKTWGGLRHETVSDLLVTQGDESVALADFEVPVAAVIDSVVDADGERLSEFREKIEKHRTSNAARFTSFRSKVEAAIERRKWYSNAGARLIGLALAACVVAAVVLLWVGIDGWRPGTPRWSDVVLVALGGCAVANAAMLVVAATRVRLWRHRTRAGQEEAERWDAFRRYLTDFPRLRDAPPATLELWERFLVYGIAFGIAERVLQGAQLHMPQELHDRSSIYWITPYGDLGSGATALGIGDLSAGFGSALTPPSSSGSGGGFSGGGGGGG
ncbi:MAG TPA: DUF2207 domain-containing protein, partial [Gaiellaceae bacterium]|nr:DUF2207 domain-containing protein [Gaiellaceae bacterium]